MFTKNTTIMLATIALLVLIGIAYFMLRKKEKYTPLAYYRYYGKYL